MDTRAQAIKDHQWTYLTNYLRAHKMSYQDYLHPEHWQDVRARFWASKLHNGGCAVCNTRVNLQVHHRSYRRVGHEKLSDLVLLCGDCHKLTHQCERNGKGILWGAVKRARRIRMGTGGKKKRKK
jgi:5-methylcytosine-specific restriction endonuclease McrA